VNPRTDLDAVGKSKVVPVLLFNRPPWNKSVLGSGCITPLIL
jgi:hypothetical protein